MSCVQAPSVTLGSPRLLVRGLVEKIATDIPQNGYSSPPAKKHKAERPRKSDLSWIKQEQLKNVQQIQANHGAFAAIRGDGAVITWGMDS